MINLVIFSILALALLITRRREGTAKIDGASFGLTCARIGRVGVFVYAYRKNRVYWRVGTTGV